MAWGTRGMAEVHSRASPATATSRLLRPRTGLAKRSAIMPTGIAISVLPMPLTDISKADALALIFRLSP